MEVHLPSGVQTGQLRRIFIAFARYAAALPLHPRNRFPAAPTLQLPTPQPLHWQANSCLAVPLGYTLITTLMPSRKWQACQELQLLLGGGYEPRFDWDDQSQLEQLQSCFVTWPLATWPA